MSTTYRVHCQDCAMESEFGLGNQLDRVQDFIDARWHLACLGSCGLDYSFSFGPEQSMASFIVAHVAHCLMVVDESGALHRPVVKRYFEEQRRPGDPWRDRRVTTPGEHHGWITYVSKELVSAIYSEKGHDAHPNVPGSVPFPAASYRYHPYTAYGRPTFQHLDRETFERRYRVATTADLEDA